MNQTAPSADQTAVSGEAPPGRPSARAPVLPERIGRFPVESLIGSGGQGLVLRARDPELERPVALKLLRPSAVGSDAQGLIDEARVVSRLQHPNIVTLYEAGEHRGLPYLVFELIDGESLASVLRREGRLDVARAVIWMSQILGGVAYAHDNGVVHRDLTPANILIARGGTPKVADFGLSSQSQPRPDGTVTGTLRYLSAERLEGRPGDERCDVFALGCIFHEMLTGQPLVRGTTPVVIARQIFRGRFDPPSAAGVDVPPQLERFLAKALARDRERRYAHAGAFKRDLDTYRIPRGGGADGGEGRETVEFLMRRMRYVKGFSALSERIGEVQKLTAAGSNASARQLAAVIGKDVTLTRKVLGTANSALYGAGKVTSLSRAIVLLGLGEVRACVTRALLEDGLGAKSPPLREALLESFMAGSLSRQFAVHSGLPERESAFIAGMFHSLGRTLVIHYFREEFEAIQAASRGAGGDELTASRTILGVAYHELGMAVARQWQLPEPVIEAMRPLPRGKVEATEDGTTRLRYHAGAANALLALHRRLELPEVDAARRELVQRVGEAVALDEALAERATLQALEVGRKYAELTKIREEESTILARLGAWAEARTGEEAAPGEEP